MRVRWWNVVAVPGELAEQNAAKGVVYDRKRARVPVPRARRALQVVVGVDASEGFVVDAVDE